MAKEPKVKVGDKFGKLKVLRREDTPRLKRLRNSTGDIYYEDTGKTNIAWVCECDCGNITKPIPQSTLIKEISVVRSCGKCPQEFNEDYTPPNMEKEEYQNFKKLCKYVEKDILGYGDEEALTRDMVMRLAGLTTGNYMANKLIMRNAKYSYEVVLNTFKFCSPDIHKALRTKAFKDENHRFNYVTKVVESNISNVYLRMQNAKKAKEKTETMVLDAITHVGAEYQKKTENKTNKLFDDLW